MSRQFRILTVCAMIGLTAACQPAGSEVLVVRNGSVIDGTGAPPIVNGLVAIENGEIVFVGPEAEFRLSESATIVDARGGTILPGLIDAHMHRQVGKHDLREGVTAVRMAWSANKTSEDIAGLRNSLQEDGNRVPAVVVGGPVLTPPGCCFELGDSIRIDVTSVEGARDAATELINAGIDFIPVAIGPGTVRSSPMLDAELIETIVEVAHDAGVPVTAPHTFYPSDVELAVALGINDVGLPPGLLPDELIQAIVSQDVIVVTTLHTQAGFFDGTIEDQRENVGRLLNANARIALGTAFAPLLFELQQLIDVGMTPMQVIVAATQDAAGAIGLGERLGTLEVGKQADVIVVDGDPLEDITVLSDVIVVIRRGEVVIQPGNEN